MRIAGGDVDDLEFVAADGVFDHVVATDLSKADDATATDNEELLGLGVVPVVAFDRFAIFFQEFLSFLMCIQLRLRSHHQTVALTNAIDSSYQLTLSLLQDRHPISYLQCFLFLFESD